MSSLRISPTGIHVGAAAPVQLGNTAALTKLRKALGVAADVEETGEGHALEKGSTVVQKSVFYIAAKTPKNVPVCPNLSYLLGYVDIDCVQVRCHVCSNTGVIAQCPLCNHMLFCVGDVGYNPDSCAMFQGKLKPSSLHNGDSQPSLSCMCDPDYLQGL